MGRACITDAEDRTSGKALRIENTMKTKAEVGE
jgi:hypothetical protein